MNSNQITEKQKQNRAKKMMLWFGMASIFMMFAGLTSAYVVSKSRPDWIKDFQIPQAFFYSTLAIIISSITFHYVKKLIIENKRPQASLFLTATLVLGITFVILQFVGFSQIIENGYYFTGSERTITTSFLYAIVFAHLLHVIGGLIVLLVVIYNHFNNKYKNGQMLGLELGITFWHFLGALWLYLILFFYFFR